MNRYDEKNPAREAKELSDELLDLVLGGDEPPKERPISDLSYLQSPEKRTVPGYSEDAPRPSGLPPVISE